MNDFSNASAGLAAQVSGDAGTVASACSDLAHEAAGGLAHDTSAILQEHPEVSEVFQRYGRLQQVDAPADQLIAFLTFQI